MKTPEEQQAFFQERWPDLAKALTEGGQDGVSTYLATLEDPLERRILALFGRQGLMAEPAERRGTGAVVALGRAGIAELLAQAEKADDAETRARFTDLANMISYNLAADLADCWAGEDRLPGSEERFQAGLEAAKACVRWREELDKGPGPRSMAYWAKGMHELSLGQGDHAAESFATSLRHAEVDADGEAAAFGVVLGRGYLGLAQWRLGEEDGREMFEAAIQAYTGQLEDAEKRDDAEFGIEQLNTVKERYPPA